MIFLQLGCSIALLGFCDEVICEALPMTSQIQGRRGILYFGLRFHVKFIKHHSWMQSAPNVSSYCFIFELWDAAVVSCSNWRGRFACVLWEHFSLFSGFLICLHRQWKMEVSSACCQTLPSPPTCTAQCVFPQHFRWYIFYRPAASLRSYSEFSHGCYNS